MKQQRPVNLNLVSFHFPVMAIVSICHRITGVLIFLCLPALLFTLGQALASEQAYDQIATFLSNPLMKSLIWAFLTAVSLHVVAGFRHILMDLGLGETLKGGRIGAWLVVCITLIISAYIGVWLW